MHTSKTLYQSYNFEPLLMLNKETSFLMFIFLGVKEEIQVSINQLYQLTEAQITLYAILLCKFILASAIKKGSQSNASPNSSTENLYL